MSFPTMDRGERRVVLPVGTMNCDACVVAIESALGDLEGVIEVTVSQAAGRVNIRYDEGKVDLDTIELAVADVGYEVTRARETLRIGGMRGAACAGRIAEAVTTIEGVAGIAVDLAHGTAKVEYYPGLTSGAEVRRVIRGLGYRVDARPTGSVP